jgi:hypothetical protein
MFEEILVALAQSLSKQNIPYMIIGGQAVLLYGEPRLTRDIDITLGVDTDRLNDLLEIIKKNELKWIPEDPVSFVKETMVLPAVKETSGVRIDFVFSFTPYETQAIKRARKITIQNETVFFASPEDVLIHKIFAGRPRDLEDVRTILQKNKNIDFPYIQQWLNTFDRSFSERKLFQTFNAIYRSLNP